MSFILHCFFSQCETENLSAEADGDDEDDGLCTFSESHSLVLQYEYHIVYSYSYSTPVLYFRAFSLGQFHVRAPDLSDCSAPCTVPFQD